MKYITHNAEEMKSLAAEVAESLQQEMNVREPIVIVLQGDFGAGKTTFAQGFAVGLGIKDPVTSPSYVYIREYDLPSSNGMLVHVDAWRVKRAEDLLLAGLTEYLVPGNVVVVEWGGELVTEFLGKLSPRNFSVTNVKIMEMGQDREVEIT